MKNLYFVSLFYDKQKSSGVNFKDSSKRLETYLSNACVALLSVKERNGDIDIALVTNLEEIDGRFKKPLIEKNIKIINTTFDSFIYPNDFKWSAAFYKLFSLKYILANYSNYYENILYTDVDVFCQLSFAPIWEECKAGKILLLDLNECSNNSLYKKFCEEINCFDTKFKFPVHYGGEFFASNTKNAIKFVNECEKYYQESIRNNLSFTSGDEVLSSLVGNSLDSVKNAGAYVYRFWCGDFRIVTSRCLFDPVAILHCPDQKETGLMKLFNYYRKHKTFPKIKRVHSMLKITRIPTKLKIKNAIGLVFKKYKTTRYNQ